MNPAMSLAEAYSFLFGDSVMGAMLVPIHRPFIHDVMVLFHVFPVWQIIGIASLGAVCGNLINWLLGHVFRSIDRSGWLERNSDHSKVSMLRLYRFRWLILLTSGFPVFGNVISFGAGVFRVRFYEIFIASLIGHAIYYSFVVTALLH
ncbi:MAG: DedA family protein [Alphaproteobacteria bacterium]|nr:DedA family protein [Alphaproteobacteria bacterium]